MKASVDAHHQESHRHLDRKVVIATVRWDHLSILPWEIYLVRYEGFPRASSL